MQHRDIPKKSKADGDDLKFDTYASRVAQGILNYSQDETFILSLEGQWGSGKTSLMNFIKNEIKGKVEILHFNPWLITDIEQVIKLFFDELMKILISKSFDAKLKEDMMKDFKSFASLILPESLNINVGVFKVGYKPKDTLLPKNEKSLEEVKKSINNYLKKLDKKIVIVVDDIDRLTDKETEFIFRLVKGIADFDNLIYILLYDKDVVSKSLEKFKSENGQKYLEKIVQYPLTVPKPHKTTIKNLLFEELDKILKKLDDEDVQYIFNEETWGQVQRVIDNYIKTVRDINQIVNIISFEYPIIVEEVNFTDFFVISLIKLKNHNLYELIQNKPNNFFLDKNRAFKPESEEKKIQENFENNMKEFHYFRDLLEIIFPIFSDYDYRPSGSHKMKYINNIYYFENYFSFATSDDKISMKEYYEIKDLFVSGDFLAFEKLLLEVDEKQKTSYFLDMYYEFDEHIEKEEIENVFFNTLKVIPKLQAKDKAILSLFNVSIGYEKLAYDVLMKHPDVDKFILNFYKINEEVELKSKVKLFEKIKNGIEGLHGYKKLNISDETFLELKSIVKGELESISFESMSNYNGIPYLLFSFDLVGASNDKLKKDINENIFKSNDNFFKVLDIFQSYRTVNGKYKEHYISKESLSKFIELEVVEEYINDLDKSSVSEEQNILLDYWSNNDKF